MLQERSLSQGMAPYLDRLSARARIVRSTCRKEFGGELAAGCLDFYHKPVLGKEAALLSPPPLRTRRASFPAARSSLSYALVGTRLRHILRRLHDTHLEPTDVSVNLPPVD